MGKSFNSELILTNFITESVMSGIHYMLRVRICKRFRNPGIDSKESISPAYTAWRAGTTNIVIAPASQAGNRFLGSVKGLQILAQVIFVLPVLHRFGNFSGKVLVRHVTGTGLGFLRKSPEVVFRCPPLLKGPV